MFNRFHAWITMASLAALLSLSGSATPAMAAEEAANPDVAETNAAADKLRSGDSAAAEEMLDKVLKSNDKNALAYQLRSIARSYRNNPEGALEDISRSLDLGPKNIGKFRSRAIIYLQLKKYKEASEDFQIVVNTQKEHAKEVDRETLMLLAVSLFCAGTDDAAAIQAMVAAAKASTTNNAKIGALYLVWSIAAPTATQPRYAGQFDKMVKMLEKEVKEETDLVATAKKEGKSTKEEIEEREFDIQLGRFIIKDLSEKDLLTATANAGKPQLCQVYYYIGMQYLASGDKPNAEIYLQKSVDTQVFRNMCFLMAEGELKLLKAGK